MPSRRCDCSIFTMKAGSPGARFTLLFSPTFSTAPWRHYRYDHPIFKLQNGVEKVHFPLRLEFSPFDHRTQVCSRVWACRVHVHVCTWCRKCAEMFRNFRVWITGVSSFLLYSPRPRFPK